MFSPNYNVGCNSVLRLLILDDGRSRERASWMLANLRPQTAIHPDPIYKGRKTSHDLLSV